MHSMDTPLTSKLTRGQALDVSEIDHELLKLYLPQIQSMFKYFSSTPFLHSINVNAIPENRYDLSSLTLASSPNDRIGHGQHLGANANNEGQQRHLQRQLQQEYYNPSSKYVTNVVMYCLKGILLYFTLIRNDIATPGMSDLNVTFKPPLSSSSSTRNRHKHKMYRYLFLSSVLPLIYELIQWKRRIYLNQIEIMIDEVRNNARRERWDRHDMYIRSIQRKLLVLHYILKVTSFIVPPLQLYAFVDHLWNRTSSPTISMSSSDLQYDAMELSSSRQNQRHVNFLYAQRRLWYEEFMLTAGMVVPLDVWKDLPKATQKCYKRYKKWIMHKFTHNRNDPRTQIDAICSICSSEPTIPYVTNCRHIYCYTCLRSAIIDRGMSYYRCEVCGSKVTSSKRYLGS